MLLINFKAYEEASGKKALEIARISGEVSKKLGKEIGVVPGFLDIQDIVGKVSIPVFSQGVSVFEPGAHTGAVTASSLKILGVNGVVLNHSENRINIEILKKSLGLCRKYGLKTLVCAEDAKDAGKIARLKPDYIAIEPPELIGGKVSVSTAKPEVIEKGLKAIRAVSRSTKVLVGAGVNSREDVRKAVSLGTQGVFVASAVCKSKNKRKIIEELAGGLI
jgi:triosephosphate isomerase